MRINNNLMAYNTHRQLSITGTNTSKAMEKLSSGLRINRAGDDAAGLAISEKMRAQIRGLDQASRNAQDAISLIQTAEGALNETHAILQRMRELAVQASTDTNTKVDRSELQKEMNELIDEIDRIAEQTQFNEQNLLDGSFSEKKFHIGANEGQNITLDIKNMGSGGLKATENATPLNVEDVTIADDDTIVTRAEDTSEIEIVEDADNGSAIIMVDDDGESVAVSLDEGMTWYTPESFDIDEESNKLILNAEEDDRTEVTITDGYAIDGDVVTEATDTVDGIEGVTVLKDGDETVAVKVGDDWYAPDEVEAADGGLGISDLKVDDLDSDAGILSSDSASEAITTIQSAIETVSAERSKLGAYQNRLEHTIKNLDTSAENLQASEARIRDVDMAKEMMEFTKNTILQQAATAMLAQANQQPQTVLQLLR